jgi:hypothetical protein
MNSTKKWSIGTVSLLILFFLAVGLSHSALNTGYRKALEVAYMNGYVEALKADLDKIEELKQNPSLFEKTVKEAAARYLKRVSAMNARR